MKCLLWIVKYNIIIGVCKECKKSRPSAHSENHLALDQYVQSLEDQSFSSCISTNKFIIILYLTIHNKHFISF